MQFLKAPDPAPFSVLQPAACSTLSRLNPHVPVKRRDPRGPLLLLALPRGALGLGVHLRHPRHYPAVEGGAAAGGHAAHHAVVGLQNWQWVRKCVRGSNGQMPKKGKKGEKGSR